MGLCDPSAGPCTWPCWTSYNWPRPIDPVCPDSSAEPSCPQADEHSRPTWCQLQTYWGSTNPFIQIVDKDIKQNWPQYWALGNTTHDQVPTGFNSIHHHSLCLAIQPVFLPSKECTCPSHDQADSPEEFCGKWCQRPYQSLGRWHLQPFPHPLSGSPCHRRRSGQDTPFINPC